MVQYIHEVIRLNRYSNEFKEEAVKRVLSGVTASQVAREIGVNVISSTDAPTRQIDTNNHARYPWHWGTRPLGILTYQFCLIPLALQFLENVICDSVLANDSTGI